MIKGILTAVVSGLLTLLAICICFRTDEIFGWLIGPRRRREQEAEQVEAVYVVLWPRGDRVVGWRTGGRWKKYRLSEAEAEELARKLTKPGIGRRV